MGGASSRGGTYVRGVHPRVHPTRQAATEGIAPKRGKPALAGLSLQSRRGDSNPRPLHYEDYAGSSLLLPFVAEPA